MNPKPAPAPTIVSAKKPLALLLGCLVLGGVAGAIGKARFAESKQPAPPLATLPLPPASADTDAVADAEKNEETPPGPRPEAPPQPRPSFDELKAAAETDRLRLLVRWLPEAAAEEIGALAQAWFSDAHDSGNEVWQALVTRWVEVDPEAALAMGRVGAERLLKGIRRVGGGNAITMLHHVYRAFSRVDADRALASLLREPPHLFRALKGSIRHLASEEKLRAWAMSHPERTNLEFLRKLKENTNEIDLSDPVKAASQVDEKTGSLKLAYIARQYAGKDAAAALAWARGLPEGRQRDRALCGVAEALLKTDPAQARTMIDSLPHHLGRAKLETQYAGALAAADPKAALAFANENLHGITRLEAITSAALALSKTDPLEAFRLLREHHITDFGAAGLGRMEILAPESSSTSVGRTSVEEMEAILRAAAIRTPDEVLDFLAQSRSLQSRDRWDDPSSQSGQGAIARGIINDWLASDTEAAARWLGQQAPEKDLRLFVKSAAEKWFAQDAAGLQAYVASMPPSEARAAFVGNTAVLMAASDPAGALEWAGQAGGAQGMGAAFHSLASANPSVAMEFFDALPATQQQAQLQHLTDHLGSRDPVAAADFYATLPAEQQAEVKLRDTILAFAKADPQAASEWIAALPETPAKDSAISGLVDYLIQESSDPDPEAAAHWAAASLGEEAQQRRLQRVAEAWFQRAPQDARQQIESSSLSPAVKNTLLRHAPKR